MLTIDEIEREGHRIKIPIQVAPEFPLGIFTVVVALTASRIGEASKKKLATGNFYTSNTLIVFVVTSDSGIGMPLPPIWLHTYTFTV